jgi:hypothetical protein
MACLTPRFFPDHLYAYILHFDKDEEGKSITRHRLFKTEIARDSAQQILESWYELEIPISSWMGDIEGDPTNPDQIYISYVGARDVRSNAEWTTSLIYSVKYNKRTKALKRSMDISRNLPYGISGRFNLEFINSDTKELFFATRLEILFLKWNRSASKRDKKIRSNCLVRPGSSVETSNIN